MLNQFIKLQPQTKRPLEKLDITYSRRDIATASDVGLLITEPYVVVDIDDPTSAEKVLKLIEGEDINCRIMKTTRGIHLYFKTSTALKNSILSKTALTVHVDYRSWGVKASGEQKKSYVKVKQDGEWRPLLRTCRWDVLDEIPKWLLPLSSPYDFTTMGEGDGRNQKLYEYIIFLQKAGYNRQEVIYVIQLINQYILDEPLDNYEIETICREEAFIPQEKLDEQNVEWFDEKNRFLHNIFGDHLIDRMVIVTLNGLTYVYEDGYYQYCDNLILAKMIELYPSISQKQRSEVLSYIKIQTHLEHPTYEEYVVNVKNGRLDLRTGTLTPHSPIYHDFARVNATYDPAISDSYLYKVLQKVFVNDDEVYRLFKQIVGYTLTRNAIYQTSFFLLGDGSNGKSTILDMIKNMLGKGNVSTLSLLDLESKFKIAELENRLANIGDDIPNLTIRDTGLFKKLTSGEGVTVERKNQHPFTLENTSTLWFSTNKMPSFADKSHGLERRMVIIPFDATFSPNDPDYDPDIREKLSTDQAMSALLNLAVEGLQLLRKVGRFIIPERVKQTNAKYKVESSSILTFAKERFDEPQELCVRPVGTIFRMYQIWCADNGYAKPFSKRQFVAEIKNYYQFDYLQIRTGKGEDTTGKGTNRDYYFVENRPV